MRGLLLIPVVVLLTVSPRAETLSSGDFAAGYYLQLHGPGPLYSLSLPAEVYRTVRTMELDDISVFDGNGRVSAHMIRHREERGLEKTTPVPLFPLTGREGGAESASIELQVRRGAQGSIVAVREEYGAGSDQSIVAYLLDLSTIDHDIRSLELDWQKDSESSLFSIRLEHSDDLKNWFSLVGRAVVADLDYGGNRVVRRKIELPQKARAYVRLRWLEKNRRLSLQKVSALSSAVEERRVRQWQTVSGTTKADDPPGTYLFANPLRIAIDSVQLPLPADNAVARLRIASSNDQSGTWENRCEWLAYDVSLAGGHLRSEPCVFAPTADDYWRLEVLDDGAGLVASEKAPVVRLGWRPHELIFLARGSSPYLLAYGSGKILPEEQPHQDNLVAELLARAVGGATIDRATLGDHVTLGGDKALEPIGSGPPWRLWLLWLVLVAGVVVLLFMARNLRREMAQGKDD